MAHGAGDWGECIVLHRVRPQYLRDGTTCVGRQHDLHVLPHEQRSALANLGVVSLQGGLLLRPDHGDNNDGLRGLPRAE